MSKKERLSPHFCVGEVFDPKKSGKTTPRDKAKAAILCYALLEPARAQLGGDIPIIITSGKRSPAYNAKKDGSKRSHHLFTGPAAAVDFTTGNPAYNAEVFRWLQENRAHAYGELIAYLAGTEVRFMHIALPTAGDVGETMISNHVAPRAYLPFKGVLREPKRR